MPGLIGPLLTTGVALSVAAVVVANPVIVPRADLQIPAVQLSGTGDAMDMLDKDFISAIGPAQTESPSNPFAVLRDLVSTLAANASYLGRNAIVAAFFAGATAVTDPELTAASFPYVPPPVDAGGAVDWPASGVSLPAAGPVSTEQLLALAAVPADLLPAAAEIVMTLMDDVHGVTDDAVTVAFAAGALLMTRGARAIDTLRDLVDRDLGALGTAISAVTSGDSPREIVTAIRDVIERPVYEPHSFLPWPPRSPEIVDQTTGAGPLIPPIATEPVNPVAAERIQRREVAAEGPAMLPAPVAAVVDEGLSLADTSLADTSAAGPSVADGALPAGSDGALRTTGAVRIPLRSGPLNNVVTDARKQTDRVLHSAADTVRHVAESAVRAVAGPTGD